ncbi:hypothetical protein [Acidihalobacter ferrooxydans]|uniref:Helix-turn-helix domain-containing protein n=1 Tax=Acidihalobacter ferrooxydans TaxID=1765967 RepID=A0A1P8UGE2_9GAMM|nr:hypothetical protein [Acidihalobacter ferrooxydans]APZ42928.1 hypothetical protein BW247_07340 [Acidihalobacter ferrooxydans]
MSAHTKRQRATGRRESGSFAAIPHAVLKTRKYASLSAWPVKLMLDLVAQYTGKNNGDFTAAWSVMREKGWNSKGTLTRALDELAAVGFIRLTRQGGRHRCALYAITWQPIDECLDRRTRKPKLDVMPTKTPPGGWRDEHDEEA